MNEKKYVEVNDLLKHLPDEPYKGAIRRVLHQAPAADVAPVVHARWLTWEEQFPGSMPKKKNRLGVFCSSCHNHSDNMFDYCPNCSAKMDEERK